MYTDPGNVPEKDKYAADDPKLGRPQDTNTTRNKQDSNFGKDRLGVKGMKNKDKNDSNPIKNKFKGGSPLALEAAQLTYNKHKEMFKSLNKKKLIFEEDKDDTSLLYEKQLKK